MTGTDRPSSLSSNIAAAGVAMLLLVTIFGGLGLWWALGIRRVQVEELRALEAERMALLQREQAMLAAEKQKEAEKQRDALLRDDEPSEIPGDIWQRVVSDFGQQRADEIYSDLLARIPSGLANGTRPRHLRCILYLAQGDQERLDRYIEMCLRDTRDVMVGAEYESAADPELVRKRDFNKPFDQAQINTD